MIANANEAGLFVVEYVSTGMGAEPVYRPLPWAEVEAWARCNAKRLYPEEIWAVRQLSEAAAHEYNAGQDAPLPWKPED